MELRRCSHTHFIQAIKNGLVIKSLSVNSCGKPVIKFRRVKELYETDEQNESSALHLKNVYGNANIECESVSLVERKTSAIDREAFTSSVSRDNNTGNCDDNFEAVTLQQIRQRCKDKKRKLSDLLSLTEENAESSSCIKHEQPKDELDLMVPLIRLKSKHLKKNKKTTECSSQNICNVPQTAVPAVKSEDSQSCMELLNANNKVVFSCKDYWHSPNNSHSVDFSVRCNELSGSSGLVLNGMHEDGNGFVADSEVSIFSRKETQNCTSNKADVLCPDNSDSTDMSCCVDVHTASSNEPVDSSRLILDEMLEAANGFFAESGGSICSRKEPPNCNVDEIPDTYIDEDKPNSYCTTWVNSRGKDADKLKITGRQCLPMPTSRIMETCVVNEISYKYVDQDVHNPSPNIYDDNSETTCRQSLPLPVLNIKEGLVTHPLQRDINQEAPISTTNCSSDKIDCSQNCSVQQKILFRTDESSVVQGLDVASNIGLAESAASVVKAEKLTNTKGSQSCIDVKALCLENTGKQNMLCSFDASSLHCSELVDSSGQVLHQTSKAADGSVAECGDLTSTRKDTQNCTMKTGGVSFPDYTNSQNIINCGDACSIGCNELLDSTLIFNKTLEAVNGCVAASGPSISSREPQNCTVDEIPYAHVDQGQPTCSSFKASDGETVNARNLEITSYHSSPIPVSEGTIANCIFNKVSYESADQSQRTSSKFLATSNGIVYLDNAETISHQFVPSPLLQIKEVDNICPLPSDTYQETPSSTEDCSSITHGQSQGFHVSHEIASVIKANAGNKIQEPKLKCMGGCYGSGPCENRNSNPDDLPSIPVTDIISNLGGSSLHSCLSLSSRPALIEGNQSLISANNIEPMNCYTECYAFDASNEPTRPTLQHPPERLLSTRKTISPTSQERLCQAMKSVGLDGDDKHNMLTRKLCFGQTTVNEALSFGSNLEATEVNIDAEKDINRSANAVALKQDARKSNVDQNGSHLKGILKIPSHSRAMQLNSIRGCSQSAIAFSQRQMRDMECLTTKLTNQLKSMKGILEEQVRPEACLAASSADSADEVRMIISNATEAEKTSQKWLSMMARDCNRFCKLMRLADKDSGNEIPKDATASSNDAGKKKITFADEVGKLLCHVKIFKYDVAATLPLESKVEND